MQEGETITDHRLTCRIYRDGHRVDEHLPLDQIDGALNVEGTMIWFDLVAPEEGDLQTLQDEFNLHSLTVEDATVPHERPKIETHDAYWFLIVEATTGTALHVVFHELAIFAGKNFVVTVRHDPPYPIESVVHHFESDAQHVSQGAGYLLYILLDTIVDGYFPVVDSMEEHVDALEDRLFDEHTRERVILPEIFARKREAFAFRHAVMPMRDILNPLIRRDLPIYTADITPYYRDVYDHVARIIDRLDTLRDLVSSALDIHLSVVANRQNEVSKQLTLVATVFLPLSFIVGFFGQNFSFLVGRIQGRYTFWLLGFGLDLLVVALTILYFRSRRWF